MSKVLVNETSLTGIADAIRGKNGTSDTYKPSEMAAAIINLPSGGGGGDLPEEALVVTGNCQTRFGYGGWNWFIDHFGNQITTKDITQALSMFYNNEKITTIPFDINISGACNSVAQAFSGCTKLTNVPYIIGPERALPTNEMNCLTMSNIFYKCTNLNYIPDDYFWKIVPNQDYWNYHSTNAYTNSDNYYFYECFSLRELPDISMLGGRQKYNKTIYYYLMYQCTALNKAINLPVLNGTTYTSNMLGYLVYNNFRLARLTFKTNNGVPITAQWKSQTLDMSDKYVGYTASNYFNPYNSGITSDKRVYDDTTYQALKNDPDWYTYDVNYSRYNHDSAVETINSLPDTSAYLASKGGTNTIKFTGAAGALTDGGAINTLTEEEIAVATAKGWTVTLS